MNAFVARLLTILFHPIFMPLYGIITVLYAFPYRYEYVPDKLWNLTIMTILAMTILMPLLIVFILKKLELVSEQESSPQKQRIFPFLIFFFFYLMTFLTIKPREHSSYVFMEDKLLAAIILGSTISVVLAFFLNNFIKISVHALGVANLFMLICLLSRSTQKPLFIFIVFSIIIAGLTGSARIFLKAHTPREVYYGFMAGAMGQLIAFYGYLNV